VAEGRSGPGGSGATVRGRAGETQAGGLGDREAGLGGNAGRKRQALMS
jgi:hypothetical protein